MAKITRRELQDILDNITFGPSGVMLHKMDLRWEVEDLVQRAHTLRGPAIDDEGRTAIEPLGWRIRFSFLRPDTVTGKVGRGFGRWEFVDIEAGESTIVKTCWLLLELLVRHELMEAFQYKGVRLFDPHRSVDELALPGKLQE